MKHTEIFETVKQEFGQDIAVLVMMIVALNLSKEITMEHLTNRNSFTNELLDQATSLFWEIEKEKIEIAILVWDNLYIWECCKEMQGLGGCVYKTLTQLVAETVAVC